MDFTLNGHHFTLTAEDVIHRLRGVAPDAIQTYAVAVGDAAYPVKQAFSVATGVAREDFQSQTAQRHLRQLGFSVTRVSRRLDASMPDEPTVLLQPAQSSAARAWPWEGEVQAIFGSWLAERGWQITSMADTATKARGVDLTARKGSRRLGAEVKGWPSPSYADPRRANEVKPTRPSTQARHWFAESMMAAMMLRNSYPDHESLMVFPLFARYEDLARRTEIGRAAAGTHVVFVTTSGEISSQTWQP